MGHVLTIDSDEAFMLATELATLTGEAVDVAIATAIRQRLDAERALRTKVDEVLASAAEFRASLKGSAPSYADIDALYDVHTGLPL